MEYFGHETSCDHQTANILISDYITYLKAINSNWPAIFKSVDTQTDRVYNNE